MNAMSFDLLLKEDSSCDFGMAVNASQSFPAVYDSKDGCAQ